MGNSTEAKLYDLKSYIKDHNISLDCFVAELKAQEAANVNNEGLDAQLAFMVESGGLDWVEDSIYHKPVDD